jgi:hypothetical protein
MNPNIVDDLHSTRLNAQACQLQTGAAMLRVVRELYEDLLSACPAWFDFAAAAARSFG